jgi:porin
VLCPETSPAKGRRVARGLRQGAACLALALGIFAAGPARADDQLRPSQGPATLGASVPEPFRSWNGLRPYLAEKGLSFALNYQSDLLANPTGGVRQGATYMARLEGVVELDLEKAFNWTGALVHVGAYQIHGVGLSRHFIYNFQTVTDLEAMPTTRLDEIWIEQKLGNKVSVRVGQVAADTEFYLTPFHALPVGGAYGWPAILAQNLPNGGPAYPFASPGVRVKVQPTDSINLLAAVFDGDPVGPCRQDDPQKCNRNGINFRLRDPPFIIGEAQFHYEIPAQGGLSGNFRLGGWAHFGRFADQRFGIDGLPQADPSGIGLPLRHWGNRGIYATADQQIFRAGDDGSKGVFVYGRVGVAPADRNPVSFNFDAGINFVGIVPGRPDDQFGFMGVYARMSPTLAAADLDQQFYNAAFGPVRDHEALLQATYAAQILPGWVLQPNIQYVIHPGGHIPDPLDPLGLRAIPNAFVVGLRSSIKY